HDVAAGTVHRGGDHRPDRAEMVDEDGFVLPCFRTGTGGEDHRVATANGVIDRMFEISEYGRNSESVKKRALRLIANHGNWFIFSRFQQLHHPLSRFPVRSN